MSQSTTEAQTARGRTEPAPPFEIGLVTFGERIAPPGEALVPPEVRYAQLLEEVELAEAVGLDVYGVGEHHRADFPVSSPAIVLAAAAARTRRIRLTSAVTVLSSADPVRVFQDFATLDLLSGGRAELMAGRGSFVESFPLFGLDLGHYDELFAEKLDLLLRLRASERVTWSGRFRPPLRDQGVHPRPLQEPLPVWIAVGGTPASAARAGALGLPLNVAIIGGLPERFAPLVGLYRRAAEEAGHAPERLPVAITTHGFLARDEGAAVAAHRAPYLEAMNRVGRERGWPAMRTEQYEAARELRGALAVGTPEAVIEKALFQVEQLRHERFLLQLSVGTVPHRAVLEAIELLGTEVAPVLRREVASRRGT
jgi:probable LLM family oxidoreductase